MPRIPYGTAAALALALAFLPSPRAHAVSIEVLISGSTDLAEDDIVYPEGGTFTARIVVDGAYPDLNPSPDAGRFFDFVASALQSFEVTTPLGTVTYLPATVTGAIVGPQVGQIDTPDTQQVTIASATTFTPDDGFSGAITGLGPLGEIGLLMTALGPNDYFFTDPNELFSGSDALSREADTLGGLVTISSSVTGNGTVLPFGATEFTIRPVPLPAAVWSLATACAALFALRRRTRS
jgi:hypothetical protein